MQLNIKVNLINILNLLIRIYDLEIKCKMYFAHILKILFNK